MSAPLPSFLVEDEASDDGAMFAAGSQTAGHVITFGSLLVVVNADCQLYGLAVKNGNRLVHVEVAR